MARPTPIAKLGAAVCRTAPPPPPHYSRLAWWAGCVLFLVPTFAIFHFIDKHQHAGDDYTADLFPGLCAVACYLASAYCGARSFRARWAQSLWLVAQVLGPILAPVAYDALIHHHHFYPTETVHSSIARQHPPRPSPSPPPRSPIGAFRP